MHWYGFLYIVITVKCPIYQSWKSYSEKAIYTILVVFLLYILKQLKASGFKLTHCSVVCLCTNNFKALYPGIVHGN